MFKPLKLCVAALLALAPLAHAAPKKAAAPAAQAYAPAAAKASTSTAKPKPLAPPPLAPAEVGKLDAVRLGISKVEKVASINKAAYPVASLFQDPRDVTKLRSPDGKKQVWRGLDKKGYCLFLSDADGKNEKRLNLCKNGYQPTWSPDGKSILFSAMDWRIEARNIFLYDIAKNKVQRAFNAKRKVGPLASFSPDGKKILFSYFDDLWLMNTNGIGRSLLNVSGKIDKAIGDAEEIAWTKDGSAFCYKMRGEATVYVVTLAPKI